MKNWQTGSIIEAEDLNRYEAAIQPVTEQNDGILSRVDKVKLDGISEGAQKNPDTATLTKNGLMSATDKVKLDGIATGAQVNPVKANQSEAEAGTDDTKMMTPIRVKQSVDKMITTAFNGASASATSSTYTGLMSLRKRGALATLRVSSLARNDTNNSTNSFDETILTVPNGWFPLVENVGQFLSGEGSGKLRMGFVHLYTDGTVKVTSFLSSNDEAYTNFRPSWNGQITFILKN